MSAYRNKIFGDAFAKIAKEIEFDRNWSNGTGYFDGAVEGAHAPKLAYGEMVKCNTPGDRRLIIIGTRLGNVAVFDRFSNQAALTDKDGIYVTNQSSAFREGAWIENGALSEGDLTLLFGDCGRIEYNIGWRTNQVFDSMKKYSNK